MQCLVETWSTIHWRDPIIGYNVGARLYLFMKMHCSSDDVNIIVAAVGLQDLFEHVRPRMKRHTSFEEAFEAVAAIEAEEAAAAAAGVQADDSDSEDGGSRPGFGSDDEGAAMSHSPSM
jgi:hypothetical protein